MAVEKNILNNIYAEIIIDIIKNKSQYINNMLCKT